MDIKYSRRILVLGTREAGALDIVKDLTGSAPAPDVNGSTAGLTHEWNAKTAYYQAAVPIWVDEILDVEAWKTEFLREEAKEVVEAVGAWILCFVRDDDGKIGEHTLEAMEGIRKVIDTHAEGCAAETLMLAVARSTAKQVKERGFLRGISQEDQEDKCMEHGFEYVDYTASGSNEFGEKQGFERLKEVLETNEWSAMTDESELNLDDLGLEGDDDFGDYGREEAEMTAELFGMKAALMNDDLHDEVEMDGFVSSERQADQVEDLTKIMGKLLAIKEQSADLPEEQRKRMAVKAVKEIMQENPNI